MPVNHEMTNVSWLSYKEWIVIVFGCLLCAGIYFSTNLSMDTMVRASNLVEATAKVHKEVTKANLLMEAANRTNQSSGEAVSSLLQAKNYLEAMLNGGSAWGVHLPQIEKESIRTDIRTSYITLESMLSIVQYYDSSNQSANWDYPQFSMLSNKLSQQLEQLEVSLSTQIKEQINAYYDRQLGLIAIVLLTTAICVVVIRRYTLQQMIHRSHLEETEATSRLSAKQLQHVIDGGELGYYDWDYTNGNYQINQRWAAFLGLPASQLNLTIEDVMGRIHPDDYGLVQQLINRCIESRDAYSLEYRMRHQDGNWIWCEGTGKVVEHNPLNHSVLRICGTLRDVSRRKLAEQEYRENERRFRQLIESLPSVAVQGYNRNREVIYWNDASTKIYGYGKNEALGQRLEDLIIPDEMRLRVIEAHKKWIHLGDEIPASEIQLRHKNGHLVPVFSSHVMLREDTDSPEMFCVDVDLTAQHRAATELKRMATLDLLTNLPNRRFLEEELKRRISEAKRFDHQLAVLFIDLDLFKEINDTMGHNAGDSLLEQVAERLRIHLRQYDTLSRFGGDEFIVVLPNLHDRESIESVSDKLMSEFERTFRLFEQEVYVTASIGISVYPDDGDTGNELLKNADAAMYQAKDSGRNRYRFFAQSMNEQLKRQREIATCLRQSLEHDEFALVYQPQINLNTEEIVSCEALLRWTPTSPDSWTSPGEFIPVAERSDLIIRIGQWVIKAACRQVAKWRSLGIKDLRIDINVSGKQVHHSHFFEGLTQTLSDHGLTPRDIGIELTENVLISADSDMLGKIMLFRNAGMEISIDDFGTGYSSLSYLKLFPVQNLKIDRSFVVEAPHNPKDQAIMEAIVNVGHRLDMKIVVEGIETIEQAEYSRSLGCDLAQGYLFYKPMPAGELYKLIKPTVQIES
ncbi:putative bifunctional diguanylate cyclase/phosphodiesterase [Echinimonas agarilytica]|uniref:EAL domain-containing protein n=1 Tax=Echinimonas agarilytica TaxID=1215918 RepID=A0AA41W4Y7_9GAMM|nr:EAL domain-containing protein [Echinimonas agarilytica]MCM2679062.1 EAL domain-containing protein [Echinimonas agarilytica]